MPRMLMYSIKSPFQLYFGIFLAVDVEKITSSRSHAVKDQRDVAGYFLSACILDALWEKTWLSPHSVSGAFACLFLVKISNVNVSLSR